MTHLIAYHCISLTAFILESVCFENKDDFNYFLKIYLFLIIWLGNFYRKFFGIIANYFLLFSYSSIFYLIKLFFNEDGNDKSLNYLDMLM